MRQLALIRSGAFEGSLAYWRERWSKYAPTRIGFADLGFVAPPSDAASNVFAAERSEFDAETSRDIRKCIRESKATSHNFFLALYGEVLRRYTGKSRLALWGHFANRANPEVHDSVGWFANTHLLGLDLEPPSSSLRSRLRRVRPAILEAYEHQEMPVALLWRKLGAYPNHPDAKLLLEVSVADRPVQEAEADALKITHKPLLNPRFGRFSNLGLYIRDDGDCIRLSAEYAAERFSAAGVRHLLDDFRREVEGVVRECAGGEHR